jgi:Na+/H+ antiporter NhaD/arsenite permease-like protein
MIVQLQLPMSFATMPIIGALFLLAISAIDRQQVQDGTIGTNTLAPIDLMTFSLTMGYISLSIDSSGLIRYMAFKTIQKAGNIGHRLFLYIYVMFFAFGTVFGNDPIIEAGTSLLFI